MRRSSLAVPLSLAIAACGRHHDHPHARPDEPRRVGITVEVYDPVTNLVWENVSVRVVESWQEWAGGTFVSPWLDTYLTDASGRVRLDAFALADAEVGFLEDGSGRALLHPYRDEDEGTVLLEIDGDGFAPVFVEVPLRWDLPDVFVEVPFS
jgi:hypothetical protein